VRIGDDDVLSRRLDDAVLLPGRQQPADGVQGRARHFRNVLTGHRKGDLDPLGCLASALIDHAQQGAGDTLLDRLRCHFRQGFLYLTKPLGVGILTSASKKGKVTPEDLAVAVQNMSTLNKVGEVFAQIDGVNAMTDVTGFGLAGHLLEICRGSGLKATVSRKAIPTLPNLQPYIDADCIPGGTHRNAAAFGKAISGMTEADKLLFCDPQTSGGLMVSVAESSREAFEAKAREQGLELQPLGRLEAAGSEESLVFIED